MGNYFFYEQYQNKKLQEKNIRLENKILKFKKLLDDKRRDIFIWRVNYQLMQMGFMDILKENEYRFDVINKEMIKMKRLLKVKTS